MGALKSYNFHAAVSTIPYPTQQPVRLTIGELARPAVVRYGGFPLFIRSYVQQTSSQDNAFNLFFGRPILMVEHHDVFKHPEPLLEVVQRINSVAPGIIWSNLESAVDNSLLRLRASDGTVQVRAYSSSVQIVNDSASVERFSIEWSQPGQRSSFEQALRDGAPFPGVECDDAGIRVLAELAPDSSQTFSVVYHHDHSSSGSLGFSWNAKAFLRTRLCEVRDNYVSKNPYFMKLAQTLQRHLLS
jgi:hypothetical protein